MTKRKILTVVLLSGCGTTAASKSTPPTPPTPRAAEVPVAQVFGVAHVAEPAPIIAIPAATPPPVAPDDKQPAWRLELRGELYNTERTQLATQMDRFRALCDADGYPLVGNVSGKLMKNDVASYCGNVRTSAQNDA
jgi:hypothetical protein